MAFTTMACFLLATLLNVAHADFRLAARPAENQNQGGRYNYKLRQENGAVPFVNDANVFYKYMEPSTFEYQGLAGNNGQKKKNYDNFLRSNIDNEQDNRQFVLQDGQDHLPFRTMETSVLTQEAQVDLTLTTEPGKESLIPFRWNNPHASELEVNIWIFPKNNDGEACKTPIVVPIKKPTCSGEGYQDGMIKFKIPADFYLRLGERIAGFTGCTADANPMCTVQVYAHSVESRMYSAGFPIIIAGNVPANNLQPNTCNVPPPPEDVQLDLSKLGDLCLSGNDDSQHIESAAPQRARLMSDVYNHAYQNSDFSPYAGQQPTGISKNLQASAVNKMVTGNRGELGKNAIPQATKNKLNQLSNQEDQIYKKYEALANNIINRLGRQMKNTGTITANAVAGQPGSGTTQQLANTFRAAEAGSTKTQRQQTNTYIPSFQLRADLVEQARTYVPNKYSSLIDAQGRVKIYEAAMNDLMPAFQAAANDYGIVYQPNHFKALLTTAPDATQFKKRNANGQQDNGKYAGTQAIIKRAEAIGCQAAACLQNGPKAALYRDSDGTTITGASCENCAKLFQLSQATAPAAPAPTPLSELLAAGGDLPDIGVQQIEDYPDEDGTERVGRPPTPSTTLRKTYEPPPGWTPTGVGGGGGGVGVVGAAMRPISDACLTGMLLLVVVLKSL